jgi:hypothetical protein
MINTWWLVGAMGVFLILLFWIRNIAYRHGIWDGAFNHFLPVVQREMYSYDEHRAAQILEAEFSEWTYAEK